MPLEAPNLDTRTYDDLVQEALLRIQRYTPEWTDFNESDPGITIIELFAWFTETMLAEMNRVPERSYIKFLQLLGMQLRPAQPARSHLTFTAKPDALPVPAGSQIGAQPPPGAAGPLIFETEEGLDLIGIPLTDVVIFDGASFITATSANESGNQTFRPLGWVPAVTSALYLGLTQSQPPAQRPFPGKIRLRVFLPPPTGVTPSQNANEVKNPPPPPVDLVWEYRPASNPDRWQRLSLYKDESLAFTREGYILIQGPQDAVETFDANVTTEKRLWLRCRLDRKTYPAGREPEIAFIRTNTVEAINVATVRDEIVLRDNGSAQSDGSPNQTFVLRRKPVFVNQPDDGKGGSLVLKFEPRDGADLEDWERVDDFLHSSGDDPHYILDPNAGTIRTGGDFDASADSSERKQRGRIPAAGGQFVATQYRWGGGKDGNAGPDTITAPLTNLTGVDKVTNVRQATGGRDEQSVDELKSQAPHELRSRNRAVTSDDYGAIAQEAGGVKRARALPLWHPDHPGVDVPGAVTVVIVPDTDEPNPVPSADLITSVCNYLDGFRLLTTELFVAGPTYVPISVTATIQVQPYAAFDQVAQRVMGRLNAYLDPLGRKQKDFKLAEQPWEFGQPLHPTNLYAVILGDPDVLQVPRLALTVNSRDISLSEPLVLPKDGLFYGTGHLINVTTLE